VRFSDDRSDASEWIRKMLDRAANETSGLQAPSPIRTGFQRRKPAGGSGSSGGGGGGGGGAKSTVAGVGIVSGNGYAGNWQKGAPGNAPYSANWWTELEAVLANSSDTSLVFIASETFANVSSVIAGVAELGAASWDPVEYVTAGPLNIRLIVARAEVTFLDNVTYDVIIEYSQQYNFSVVSDTELTFIVPPWTQEITDDDGYANVTVSTIDGPATLLSLNLYYTEDCPQRGWFGSGLSCRPCLQGGYRDGHEK
jgi:hypothetical protein